jgi:hypothetical protein
VPFVFHHLISQSLCWLYWCSFHRGFVLPSWCKVKQCALLSWQANAMYEDMMERFKGKTLDDLARAQVDGIHFS